MFNIYFFPKNTGYYYFDESRVINGAVCWEGELPDDFKCVVTQTGSDDGYICLLKNNAEVITAAIADNNSPKINELMAALMKVWAPELGDYVLPYAERSVSFNIFNMLDQGERYHGSSYEVLLTVKMQNPAIYLPYLRDMGIKILSPDIVLYCDVAVDYIPNILREDPPHYLDYATASNCVRHSFMLENYNSHEIWNSSDEEELSWHNSSKRPMKYYNYDASQMRELLYSGRGRMREIYTADEVSAIFKMRDSEDGYIQPTRLSIEDGKALYNQRAELNSSEGGFKDLIYPRIKLNRTLRLAIYCKHAGETTTYYQDVTMLTIGEFKARLSDMQEEQDPINALANLCGCKPAVFKSYFATTTDVVWNVELQELLSHDNADDIKLTVLENIK